MILYITSIRLLHNRALLSVYDSEEKAELMREKVIDVVRDHGFNPNDPKVFEYHIEQRELNK